MTNTNVMAMGMQAEAAPKGGSRSILKGPDTSKGNFDEALGRLQQEAQGEITLSDKDEAPQDMDARDGGSGREGAPHHSLVMGAVLPVQQLLSEDVPVEAPAAVIEFSSEAPLSGDLIKAQDIMPEKSGQSLRSLLPQSEESAVKNSDFLAMLSGDLTSSQRQEARGRLSAAWQVPQAQEEGVAEGIRQQSEPVPGKMFPQQALPTDVQNRQNIQILGRPLQEAEPTDPLALALRQTARPWQQASQPELQGQMEQSERGIASAPLVQPVQAVQTSQPVQMPQQVAPQAASQVPQQVLQQVLQQVTPQLIQQVSQQVNSQAPQQVSQQTPLQVTPQVSQQEIPQVFQQVPPRGALQVTSQAAQQVSPQVLHQEALQEIPQVQMASAVAESVAPRQEGLQALLGSEVLVEQADNEAAPLRVMHNQAAQGESSFQQNQDDTARSFERAQQLAASVENEEGAVPLQAAQHNAGAIQGSNFQQQLQEAAAPADTPQAPSESQTDFEVPRQIVEQARLIRSGDSTEMVIHLKPEHLGDLTLKISVTEGGAVTASFHSDNAQVRTIIENSLVQLRQELSDQGLKVDSVEVFSGLPDGQLPQGQGQQAWQQGSQGRFSGERKPEEYAEEADDLAAAALAQGQESVADDGVDYRV